MSDPDSVGSFQVAFVSPLDKRSKVDCLFWGSVITLFVVKLIVFGSMVPLVYVVWLWYILLVL